MEYYGAVDDIVVMTVNSLDCDSFVWLSLKNIMWTAGYFLR